MLTTIAVLVIVMGLMVSLARRVRSQSAELLTTQLLRDLDRLMGQYYTLNGNAAPPVRPLIPIASRTNPKFSPIPLSAGSPPAAPVAVSPPDEGVLQQNAKINNAQFMRLLIESAPAAGRPFDELPLSIYDPGGQGRPASLRDAWGNAIVFVAGPQPLIGTAPRGNFFFFSAGPDGKFLTRTDNLYSYERAVVADEPPPETRNVPPSPNAQSTTQPSAGESATGEPLDRRD